MDYQKFENYNDFEKYLYEKKSLSPSVIAKMVSRVNEAFQYKKFEIKDYFKYIDIETLLSLTITYDQYKYIISKITKFDGDNKYNIRDIVIFKLAWIGLTAKEIIDIKINDLYFNENELIIKTIKNRFEIHDPVLIEEVKQLQEESYYIIKGRRHAYRQSNYLCKPIIVGINKSEQLLSIYPVIRTILLNNNIKIDGKNIEKISFEDLRRSRICFLFANQNYKHINNKILSRLVGLNDTRHIAWLAKISNMLYN